MARYPNSPLWRVAAECMTGAAGLKEQSQPSNVPFWNSWKKRHQRIPLSPCLSAFSLTSGVFLIIQEDCGHISILPFQNGTLMDFFKSIFKKFSSRMFFFVVVVVYRMCLKAQALANPAMPPCIPLCSLQALSVWQHLWQMVSRSSPSLSLLFSASGCLFLPVSLSFTAQFFYVVFLMYVRLHCKY